MALLQSKVSICCWKLVLTQIRSLQMQHIVRYNYKENVSKNEMEEMKRELEHQDIRSSKPYNL